MEQDTNSVTCPFCQGEGGHLEDCFRCSGKGFRLIGDDEVPCKICSGTGQFMHPCHYCQGRGVLRVGDKINLEPKRCSFCYLAVGRDKSRTTLTVEGTDAKEVEMVARSLMAEAGLFEQRSLSKAQYAINSRGELLVTNAIKLFFSYAHKDEGFLKRLKNHLKPLQREGMIEEWYDRDISAGTEWEREINEHLNEAEIILLLISPDFMNSNYCYSIEMQRALERHQRGKAHVIPIILRPVIWKLTFLSQLQALPTDGKPITDPSWVNQDRAFHNVAEGIHNLIEQLAGKLPTNVSVTQSVSSNTDLKKFETENYLCYCNKCKRKTEMRDTQRVSTKNKMPAVKGTCSICGTNVYLILGINKRT